MNPLDIGQQNLIWQSPRGCRFVMTTLQPRELISPALCRTQGTADGLDPETVTRLVGKRIISSQGGLVRLQKNRSGLENLLGAAGYQPPRLGI